MIGKTGELGMPRPDYIDNGVSLDIFSIEDDFSSLKTTPIIINDVADKFSIGRTVDVINDLIRSHYDNDELNTVPSCEKGCTTGAYNYDPDNPVICKICDTPVVSIINQPLESQVWMRVPKGAHAFLHPRIYRLFKSEFQTTHFCLIDYLTNPNYHPEKIKEFRGGKKETEAMIVFLQEAGVKRGINYFFNNFDDIMNLLLDNYKLFTYKHSPQKLALTVCEKFRRFIDMYRHCVFTRYLPFPSKLIMLSERGGTAEFIDPNMGSAFDAPKTIASIETAQGTLSVDVIQSRVMKTVRLMSEYFDGYYHKTCATKNGMMRGQHGGTRGFFTGRAVIAPLAMAHEYDEIHTPWAWTVTILSVHIENKLFGRGYTHREVFRMIDAAAINYCPEIHEIINELIAECPEGGLPVSMLRNPTLRRGSNQYFRITKVLPNRNDNAIMMSVLTTKSPNADFDGDQLQVRLLVDNKEKRQFQRLASHLGIMDTDRPNHVAGFITFHPEVATMANNYLTHYRRSRRGVK